MVFQSHVCLTEMCSCRGSSYIYTMHSGIEPSGGKEISIMDVVIKVIPMSNHFGFRFSFLYLGSVKIGYFFFYLLFQFNAVSY